jgi:glycosyltransferase involved in cell wall biosynthesis
MFISLHDTVTGDRNLRAASSPLGRVARLVDTLACRSASLVMADTPAHADFFAALTDVPRAKFRVLWVGAQESVFSPVADVEPDPDLVLFYGTFIPLQGIETIVRAAKLLEGSGARVRIIGDGQERTRVERLVDELEVSNVELVAPMPLEALPAEVARAALCLGIFGTTDKAARVVPTKLYEALAVGRPVLTGDSEAIRSACDGDVATVPPGDPTALADGIRDLLGDPQRSQALAAAGHARYQRMFSETALTEVLGRIVEDAVARPRRAPPSD